MIVEGIFRRYLHVSYFASVEMEIELEVSEEKASIEIKTQGTGFISQGYVEEISEKGYEDWKAGAVAGIEYALKVCTAPPCHFVITKIEGLTTDTNPTIVAAAAIDGIWKAFDFQPTPELKSKIEQQVFDSWKLPDTKIPEFT